MRHEPAARIIQKTSWTDFHLLRLESSALAAEASPGQFLMARVSDGFDPLLRRPISLHDAGPGWVEIFFRVAGRGTALLAEKKEGDPLDCLGPLGKGFRLDGTWKGKTAWLVGGGRGIAPLFFLGRTLLEKGARVRVFYGGKTASELPLIDKFSRAGLPPSGSTDDGTAGYAGFVTALQERELRGGEPEGLFVCGPDPMMEKIGRLALERGLPAQLSLEAMMGCGFGACWGCVHKIKKDGAGKWRKICEDGPVFSADEILWEEG
jgi:dihydroorotate dehydrogenase electron transfer subunit